MWARISQEVSRFRKINLFIVLRENNFEVDTLTNEATRLKIGVLRVNFAIVYQTIPSETPSMKWKVLSI
jgi:hypothetical protein